jgi:hypothetical protein
MKVWISGPAAAFQLKLPRATSVADTFLHNQDPIFPVHHANIDRVWMKWAVLPGKSWGKLPDQKWFDEAPWFFFDVNGKEVNRPRKDYFDYRALGISFKDEDPNARPLQLPIEVFPMVGAAPTPTIAAAQVVNIAIKIDAGTTAPTVVPLLPPSTPNTAALDTFGKTMATVDRQRETVTLTLHNIEVANAGSTGFDLFLVEGVPDLQSLHPHHPSHIGLIHLFGHGAGTQERFDQTFDVTQVVSAFKMQSLAEVKLIVVPYSLTTIPKLQVAPIPFPVGSLKVDGISLRKGDKVSRQSDSSHPH